MHRISARGPAAVVVLLLVAGLFLALRGGDEPKLVTAHFPRAVSVYVGTDVRILGVTVGQVTAVVPDGESVRVEMEYDAEVDVPADAQAVVVTPTLVADRFVQLTPAYSEGEVLADGAEIELPDTAVPVELDRIYASLRDLSTALGPDGANADGTLDNLLRASSEALEGQGRAGNEMIDELSRAAETFGAGSGDLFQTVSDLAVFTDTLAKNDELVRAFIRDLAGVSADLEEEREELGAALTSVSRAVGTVETFVRENRTALTTDVEKLTRTVKTIASERESIDQALTSAPVSIGNLALAFNNETGSIGSRIGVSGNVWDADGFLCSIVQQSGLPRVTKDLACDLFESILEPITTRLPTLPPGAPERDPVVGRQSGVLPDQARYVSDPGTSLADLLGGTR